MPSEKYLSGFTAEEIKRVDKEVAKNVRWIALIMATQGLLIRGTNQPVGLLAARIRQLSLIGYTPIIVSLRRFDRVRRDRAETKRRIFVIEDKLQTYFVNIIRVEIKDQFCHYYLA